MKTSEEIQDEYAESKGFETFFALIVDDIESLDFHVIKTQKIYAKQVAEQALKDAAERLSSDKIIAKKIILSTPIKLP